MEDVLMLGFVSDTFTFLRFGYTVLCIIVGIGVVFGFFRKVCKNVWRSTNIYKKKQMKREEMRKSAAQYLPESSRIEFAIGRGQDSLSDRDR